MVIMDENKETPGSPRDVSKKMCPRAARENAKNKSDSKAWKTAHTGLRFHFDRKKLVTHEFNFNSVSKTEKVTRSRSEDNSVEKQTSTESTKTSGSKEIKVLMDTLKISKSEECSSRDKSPLRKEMPKSPVVERLTSKKACTRCSRCSRSSTPKEGKPDIKPLKIAKNHDQPLKSTKKENTVKTVKIETPQSPKICKKQCSKLAKLVEEPKEKVVKPKSILVHTDKTSRDNDKHLSKNSEQSTPPLSPKPTCKKQCSKLAKLLVETHEKSLIVKSTSVLTEKSVSRSNEKSDASKNSERISSSTDKPKSGKSNCENEKKVDFAWPVSVEPENISDSDVPITNDHSEILNGSGSPVPSETVACLLNGKHDEHICDPHAGLESPDESRREMDSMKSPSKIPRKTHNAAGLKSDASLNREMMPQPLIEL